jgi:hypothetical protein
LNQSGGGSWGGRPAGSALYKRRAAAFTEATFQL